eukprot:TRINITY_DN65964_c0_g1_i1.p2 TRINITY_DN65964_c0_g1~~TRINITY_DN65964_c0_g1_i1.p2  ORF type:complete len:126 (+),score=30.12 TRINITY_DN65964_c0_g1_i1:165-542(+)
MCIRDSSPGSLHLDGSMMPMSGVFEEASTRVEPKVLDTSAMAESISSAGSSSAKLNLTGTGTNNNGGGEAVKLSLIHISEPTRLLSISYAVFCLKKKKKITNKSSTARIIKNKKTKIKRTRKAKT